MSAVAEQHEHWRQARGRLGLPTPAPGESVVVHLRPVEYWIYRPLAPYDHYEPFVLVPGARLDGLADQIIADGCFAHGITLAELVGSRRSRHLGRARQEVYYRLSIEARMSSPAIGKKLGRRDHTTVLAGITRYKQRMGIGDA